jgi:hypothetical protein
MHSKMDRGHTLVACGSALEDISGTAAGRKICDVQVSRHAGGEASHGGNGKRAAEVNKAGESATMDGLEAVRMVLVDIELKVDAALGGAQETEL